MTTHPGQGTGNAPGDAGRLLPDTRPMTSGADER
jgi:hypothetical protein